jgi:hypothetical protein
MNINDLIILLFPNTDMDEEVISGGRALFNKHVGKYLLGLKQPSADTGALLNAVAEKAQSSSGQSEVSKKSEVTDKSSAQRAWLIQVTNKEGLDLSGALAPDVHYKVLAATAAFSPGTLDKTSTGVYVVSHCDYGLLNVFGHYGRHPEISTGGMEVFDQHVDAAASKLALFLKKLGLESIQKLCLVACNTVPRDGKQKDLLECLIWKLHEQGLHPKLVGWDIPVVVVTKEGKDYGRKMHQTSEEMAASLRKKNKYVYKYEAPSNSFTLKAEKAKNEENIRNQFVREFKKSALSKEALGNPVPTFTSAPKGDDKTEIIWRMEIVRRMKYSSTNWSA